MSSADIKKHITKRLYTQTIDFVDITYSLLPKKRKALCCMPNERLLMLKGIEMIGYAR